MATCNFFLYFATNTHGLHHCLPVIPYSVWVCSMSCFATNHATFSFPPWLSLHYQVAVIYKWDTFSMQQLAVFVWFGFDYCRRWLGCKVLHWKALTASHTRAYVVVVYVYCRQLINSLSLRVIVRPMECFMCVCALRCVARRKKEDTRSYY